MGGWVTPPGRIDSRAPCAVVRAAARKMMRNAPVAGGFRGAAAVFPGCAIGASLAEL